MLLLHAAAVALAAAAENAEHGACLEEHTSLMQTMTIPGAARRAPPAGGQVAAPKIDVYVINLDSRVDRCLCMSHQLASAPPHITLFRQSAVQGRMCPNLHRRPHPFSERNATAEDSLFCSNYLVWQRAVSSDADFVLVMEDDVVLRPYFWKALVDFAQSCTQFDYVVVDPRAAWDNQGAPDLVVCGVAGSRFPRLVRASPERKQLYWGTQVQLIRRPFLATLIERAEQLNDMRALDAWWMHHVNNGTSFVWQPQVSPQAAWVPASAVKMLGCPSSTQASDIAVHLGEHGQLGQSLIEGQADLSRTTKLGCR